MLTKYLFGQLSETELEALEERFFTNDALLNQLHEVEDELIARYLDHRLDPETRRNFEQCYLEVLEHRERVAFAQSVRQAVTPVTVVHQPASESPDTLPDSKSDNILPFRKRSLVLPGWGTGLAAAASLLLAVASALLWLQNRELRKELELSRTNPAFATENQTIKQELSRESERIASLEKELQSERQKREALEKTLPPPVSGGTPKSHTSLVEETPQLAFVLLPGSIRGDSSPDVEMKAPVKAVTFKLVLPDNIPYKQFSARILNSSETELHLFKTVKQARINKRQVAVVELRGVSLPKGKYEIELSGVPTGGERQIIDRYTFSITENSK